MYHITSSMDNIASGRKFVFDIYNPEITGSVTIPCRVVSLGKLTIGNEDTEFGYSKAGDWEIELRPETTVNQFSTTDITSFFDIVEKLQKPYFYANVYEDGTLFWRGIVDSDSISSNLLETTISMKIVHETQTTSKLKCNDNPFNYVTRLGKVQSHEFFDKQYWIPLYKFFEDYYSFTSENTISSSVSYPYAVTVPVGTFSGSISNMNTMDGVNFKVYDQAVTPGFTAEFAFKCENNLRELSVTGFYTGSVSDNINIDAKASNGLFYNIGSWTPKSGSWTHTVIVDEQWNVGGECTIRFNHTSAGVVGHTASFDYMGLVQKVEMSSSATLHNYCPLIMKFYEPIDGTTEYADLDGLATSVSNYDAYLGINTNSFFAELYPDSPFPATIGELADALGESIGCRFLPVPYNSYVIDYQNDLGKSTQNISVQSIQDAQLTYSNSYQGLTQEADVIYRYMYPNVSSEDIMPKYNITMDYGNVPRKYNAISYLGEIIEKDRVNIGEIYNILVSDWMPRIAGADYLSIGLAAIYDIGNPIWERVIETGIGNIFNFENVTNPTAWNTLYFQVAEDFLALNSTARKKLQLEVDGVDYDFTKSYTITDWFGSTKFRLMEVEYDYVENFSTLWLLEI